MHTIRVRDLMTTSLITIKASEPVRFADIEMQVGNMRHLPVVDGKNHVVGMLSSRDLMRVAGTAAQVKDIMTPEVVTVREDTPAHEAAALMIDRKIGALPVIGVDDQLVGIVTETDFLEIAYDALRTGKLRIPGA